jgi:hypothetical protein
MRQQKASLKILPTRRNIVPHRGNIFHNFREW